jgi:glycosyltransferase involved in cell wall biosynthesis
MNIIIVGTAYPLRGGIAHYNALLYEELTKKHTVQVITFKRQYPSILFPGKTQTETGGELLRVPSESLVDSINPLNWIAVGREIKRRTPDLIVFKYWLPFFGPCFGTIARIAKRGTRTKVVFICDNVVPHEKHPGDEIFTRYAFNAVDYFIVQSDAVERDLLQFWPNATYAKAPHPVYNIFGSPADKQQARRQLGITAERVMLFFGYIRKYKGLHVLLDAMNLLKESKNIHLLAIGECYDDERQYRDQISVLQLQDRVTLHTEYIPNDRVGLYFSAADVVILPYLSATQSGIAQIAYNFDKPVIATRVGGLSEVVIDGVTGLICSPGDAAAMANTIRRFFEEKHEAQFITNVRHEKKKYTWEAMANAIEDLAAK